MRQLVLSPELWPIFGGVGNYVVQIVKNMPRDDEIEIVAPARSAAPSDEQDELNDLKKVLPSNATVTFLGGRREAHFRRPAFMWRCREHLMAAAVKGDFDIVHAASSLPDFFLSPKRLGMPLLSTIHTTIEGHWQSLRLLGGRFRELNSSEKMILLFGPCLSFAESSYYTNSRYYITVSEWAKREIVKEKRIDPARIRMIYNGVDADNFTPYNREKARRIYSHLADIDAPKVLYLSRMAARKGIGLLLRAVPKVLQKVDAHFVFAGAGEKPDFGLPRQNYTYLGLVPYDHPPYLYSLSDIFVLPSLYENFPTCVLEAMASECAVVATKICGIPEMIRHEENGFMIPPNDVDAISRAIVYLIENGDLRKSLGKRARKHVAETFSWKRASAETRRYYEEVICFHNQS